MHILCGSLRGQRLSHTPNPHLRPTADKVKKAVFDMLGQNLSGRRVLDLYSGTGAYGIEALSCGAERAIFVEINRPQSRLIESDLHKLGLSSRAEVWSMSVEEALKRCRVQQMRFNSVFIDPPYERGLAQETLTRLFAESIPNTGAIVVVETRRTETIELPQGPLSVIKEKIYGDTKILILTACGIDESGGALAQ